MQHVYLHVPFCRSRCVYCDFYFELEKYGTLPTFLEALHREIIARYELLSSPLAPLQTLYLGGGTPSLLSASEVGDILKSIQTFQAFAPDAEMTFELNPDDCTSSIEDYLKAGINRFSVGVQSFQADELKKLSRRHSPEQAKNVIHQVAALMGNQRSGMQANISIDLMYGIPIQNLASWQDTVKQACELPIQHISMYGLQLEAGTALEMLVKKAPHLYLLPSDEAHVEWYEWAVTYLHQQGFQRYEASNFAKEGFESRHNLAYWQQKDVLAFGPSAHGVVHPWRYEVPADLQAYHQWQTLEDITHRSFVSEVERVENLLIFGLRLTQEGVSFCVLQEACPTQAIWEEVQSLLQKHLDAGYLESTPRGVKLASVWIPKMNNVLCDFIGLGQED